jgi:enoyl-CoA hydratase
MDHTASKDGGAPTLTSAGNCATIRLNRPRVHNRLSLEDLACLDGLLTMAEQDRSLRALVLTASGPSFCSGFNIGALGETREKDGPTFEHLADRLERCRLPTICALNGSVYGGATDLALACDFRVGVAGMTLLMPAARLGLHYYRGGLQRYVSRLGVNAAKRLFLLAEPVDTETLLRIGYLDEVVAPEALAPRVQELAAILAQRAPRAVQGMKAALNDIARGDADLAAIEAAADASGHSSELTEGRAAWLEKRSPRFADP